MPRQTSSQLPAPVAATGRRSGLEVKGRTPRFLLVERGQKGKVFCHVHFLGKLKTQPYRKTAVRMDRGGRLGRPMMAARVYPAALLLLVGLALFAIRTAAGDGTAGKPAIEARIDFIERRFEAGQQAEERMRSELRAELAHELALMTGELKRLGGRLDRCESATATSSEPEIDGSGGQKVDLDLEDFGQPSATSMPEAAGQMEKPAREPHRPLWCSRWRS